MRILLCNWKDLSHPAAGGAEVFVDAIARRWADWGHDVVLFCARASGQSDEAAAGAVRVRRAGSRFTVYREARHFYHSLGPNRFDVVVDVVNTRPFLTPRYVGPEPVVALIFQVAREIWSYEAPPGLSALGRHWLEPRWLRAYRSVPTLTISESSRDSLEAYGLREVAIVPVGLELPDLRRRPARERVPTAVFLGRLTANKRPDDALRAFRSALPAIGEGQMWVIGTGPMEAALRREFASERVRFFGRVPQGEKLDLLGRAHALLVTSVREGWGLVVTEAAATGTPSIGYDVPGLRDSLRASNGRAVVPTVDAMASAITELLPSWAAGGCPTVVPGGVASWDEVARQVLDHLEREARRNRS